MDRRIVHFLLHVPKCAGTSVEGHFRAHLGPGFLLAPRWESPFRNLIGNRYPYAPDDPRLAPVRVVSGHSLSRSLARHFPGAEIRESVLLRDPVGYFLSFYNYRWSWHRRGHAPAPPDFERWYRAQRRNPISRFLLNRYFEHGIPALYRFSSAGRLAWLELRLARFWFVGGHERAADLIAGVSAELAVPERSERRNVTEAPEIARADLGPDWIARIERDNALDALLHARWRHRGWRADAAVAGLSGKDPALGGRPDGASNPAGPVRPPGLASSGARPDGPQPKAPGTADEGSGAGGRLPAWDQPAYIASDLVSGIAKRLIR